MEGRIESLGLERPPAGREVELLEGTPSELAGRVVELIEEVTG
jgi:hypothetical protein